MRLRRIEIRDFRRLAGRWVVDGLDDGLTVIGGDNEEGKSTLLQALKAALLEHHKVGGQVREAMDPHGGGTPEVRLELELAGRPVRLLKEFGRRCELEVDGRRLAGDAAEDRLVELLRFARRQGRAERRAEHQGLLALFWVDQGTSFAPETTEAALAAQRDRLQDAVAAEVGTVAGGPELQRLLAAVEDRVERLWTARGQVRKGGELDRARGAVQALEAEAAGLAAARRAFDEAVDRLERAREERDRLARSDRLERAREARRRASEELRALDALEGERAAAAQALAIARLELGPLEAELAERERRRAELRAGRAELERLAAELASARAERAAAEARTTAAETAEREAVEAAARARRAALEAQEATGLVALARELDGLKAIAEQTAGLARELAEQRAALAELGVDEREIVALRQRQAAVERQRAALEAVATLLEPHPEPGRRASLAGTPLEPGRPLRLTERAELLLEGWGRLVLVPGGADLAERRRRLADAERALAEALAAHGLADLAEAEAAALRRREVEEACRRLADRLAARLADAGLRDAAALDEQIQIQGRRLESRRNALGAPVDPATLAGELEARGRAQRDAEAALEAARCEALEAARGLAALREREAGLLGRHKELAARVAAGQEALRTAEARRPDAGLAEALAAARAKVEAAERREAELARELARRDAEGVRARLALAEREIAGLEAEARRLQEAVTRLEGEVRGLGRPACDARLDEIERTLAAERPALAALEREAAAWKLLRDELRAAERAAQERLGAPVRRRLEPLLARLLGEASAELDPQSLAPRAIRRGGIDEPLGALSLGTREQIAVLVRLALAELLLEREGEAPCLVLDDALVFADEARFERMRTILAAAATRQQILILTCRPRDWLGLPGRRIDLEACRARVEPTG